MTNKVLTILLPLVLVALAFTVQPMTSSAHVVNPGARVRGFIVPQPDFANLNKEGVAWVIAAEIGVAPEHTSEVTGVGFLVQDDENVWQGIQLNGSAPAGAMTNFTFRIGYRGKSGEVVPKMWVRLTLDQVRVYSPGHGGDQQVEMIEPPPIPPQGETITLR